MKYTELQTAINNKETKSKKALVQALNELLKETGFTAEEHWGKSYSAIVSYKGETAFYVEGEKWDTISVVVKSVNPHKYKVRHSAKPWDHSLVSPMTDTDQDKKRIERYLNLQDFLKKSPFEHSYFNDYNGHRADWRTRGTKAFVRMKELTEWRQSAKEETERTSIPWEVTYYLRNLEKLADDRTKTAEFMEEMPKAYTKVLELIAEDNKDRAKYLESAKARVTDFIAERKTYKAF